MAYEKTPYDKTKDVTIAKFSSNPLGNKYINVEIFSYDGKEPKIRIRQNSKNTNPNADKNKQWIPLPGISGLKKEEALALAKHLTEAANSGEI